MRRKGLSSWQWEGVGALKWAENESVKFRLKFSTSLRSKEGGGRSLNDDQAVTNYRPEILCSAAREWSLLAMRVEAQIIISYFIRLILRYERLQGVTGVGKSYRGLK